MSEYKRGLTGHGAGMYFTDAILVLFKNDSNQFIDKQNS